VATIRSIESLRRLYKEPTERVLRKQLDRLDHHCRQFIALSRFVVISSVNETGCLDASPRGGDAGFIRVIDEHTLLIPDRPGNNRLDSFTNIVLTSRAGLLLLVPGVDEMLRINGSAELRDDDDLRTLCIEHGSKPVLVLVVKVEEAYLHCAKAVMRSGLWSAQAHVARSVLPTMGEMQRDQTGLSEALESPEAALARHRSMLY
jgi:PPOX class probable FMN-dependent enzyme